MRLKAPEKFEKPITPIRLGLFMRLRIKFSVTEGKKEVVKAFDAVIFNQKHNP